MRRGVYSARRPGEARRVSDDLDARLAKLVPHPPWGPLAPWPAVDIGDAALVEVAARLALAPEVANAAAEQLLATRDPAVGRALERVLARAGAGFVPYALLDLSAHGSDVQARANQLATAAAGERLLRADALVRVLAVIEGLADAEAEERLRALLASPDTSAHVCALLAGSLLGQRCYALPGSPTATMMRDRGRKRDASRRASRPVLERMAAHLAPRDPLAPFAVEAALALDPAKALADTERVLGALDEREALALRAAVFARFFDLAGAPTGVVALDEAPGWSEVIAPLLRSGHTTLRLAVGHALAGCGTSAPVVSALAHADGAALGDLLATLRRIDDRAAAGPLEAFAASAPADARPLVLALVKRLRRKRDASPTRASFAFAGAVGTDGGPIVVLRGEDAAGWRGVAPTYGTPEHARGDYERACDAETTGDFGLLDRGDGLVVAAPQVSVALVDGQVWLVSSGAELEVELAAAIRTGRKKWKPTFQVGDGGLVVLDATRTIERAEEGARLDLTVPAGRYAIEAQTVSVGAAEVRVLRLVPAKAGRARAAS